MSLEDFEDDYYEEGEESCGCDIEHGVYEWCPDCCDFGGDYQPGTETCDFCDYHEACAKAKYG